MARRGTRRGAAGHGKARQGGARNKAFEFSGFSQKSGTSSRREFKL